MKLRRVSAIAKKEFLHVIRDWRSLGIGIAIPIVMLFLFGYALTLDVDRVPLIVWDQSSTPASRALISGFTGSRYFSLVGYARSYPEIVRAIDSRDAQIALVVPVDFAAKIAGGRPVAVQAILDGSDSNVATFSLGYAEAVTRTYRDGVTIAAMKRSGLAPPRVGIELKPRVWFNSDMESRNYIFPGLIAIIMMVIAALLTSLTFAREWEVGTMEQLIATPVTGGELILGKLLPYFAIGMFDLMLSVLVGEVFFSIPLRGAVWMVFAASAIFMAGALSLGMLISIVTKSQFLASQIALVVTMLPAFLLSGFIFPIANMPFPIQLFTYVFTARYFVTLLRGIYLKGLGIKLLMGDALLLALFAVAVITLSHVKFRKKIE
ncbi:ABC transporter permease [Geomesophilobacter sediminis]|uniref:ABC transporter permease n=1 Tax=Geomesophilobacter sediminis TaxID=2798584 RepID=A0A8J7M1D2_9BACT|nr:ABC transporter permease [Geomesophilobacter sediminis]MBJ6726885.1 ABC transporter permease [Geomesophilobacter sediminis]